MQENNKEVTVTLTEEIVAPFTKKEVYEATLKYFKGDSLAANVWVDKYCLKDSNFNYMELTPDDMHKRLAREFARIELKYPNPLSYEEIYNLLSSFRYVLPGGSILYGAGNPYSISSLGSCFVIGNTSDSYGGICTTDQEQAQLMKRRAGVGHDLSHIRPANTSVSNAAGTSTGILSFMPRYSNSTREVAQDGRRGALMLTLGINHPDIEQFITSKDDLSKITGANISVKITDEFMKDVEEGISVIYKHKWGNYLSNPKKLWNKLIHQAWKSAEPGLLYWDTITRESIPSCYGKEWEETSTNPCGEIPLCPYDSCRLMSVNLYSFVEHPFTDKAYFNYDKFKDVVYKAQRLMDDVVDLEEEKINAILNKIENDPEPEEIKRVERDLWIKIKTKLLDGRRTGLSAIGLADCLAALNRGYATNEAIEIAEEIYKQFAISAYKSSIDMSGERGPFPIYDYHKEKDNPFLRRLPDEMYKYSRRNIALLTIPPSGTISLMSSLSSGIEPVYQLYYKRRVKVTEDKSYDFIDQNGDKWKEYIVLHPKFKEWFETYSKGSDPNYSFEELTEEQKQDIIKISPFYKSTAYEINPLQRVKLQATIQKFIDHSISSTINLPKGTTEETVSNLYMEAWKQGCKGLTVYVDECRTGVLVSTDKKDTEFKQHDAPKRPKVLQGKVHNINIRGIHYQVYIGLLENKPYELFCTQTNEILPSDGDCQISKIKSGEYKLVTQEHSFSITEDLTEEQVAVTRLISTSLRHGASIKFIVEQLNKIDGDLTSFTKAISRSLKKYISNNEETKEICPNCQSKIIYINGCKECSRELDPNCTYSKCG